MRQVSPRNTVDRKYPLVAEGGIGAHARLATLTKASQARNGYRQAGSDRQSLQPRASRAQSR